MTNTPWYQEPVTDENEILSSRVRLARNIKKYPFRRKLNATGASEMVAEASGAVTAASTFFRELDIQGLAKTEQTVFLEKHIISPEFLNGNLPKGLLISDNQNISVMLNEEDHVRIQSIKPGEGLSAAYETASQIDDLIEERVEFAFHSDYGYLTACPTNTGTGLRASYMIHLPCFSKTDLPNTLLPQIAKFGVVMRGIYGEGTAPMGSIYQISNQNTMGKSEHDIILGLQNVTRNVIAKEQSARENLLATSRPHMEDIVHRAYGILASARLISAAEAMNLLSDVRFGFVAGLLDAPRPSKQIYQIMMEIQPGHLQRNAGTDMTEQERDITRANFLREIFS